MSQLPLPTGKEGPRTTRQVMRELGEKLDAAEAIYKADHTPESKANYDRIFSAYSIWTEYKMTRWLDDMITRAR